MAENLKAKAATSMMWTFIQKFASMGLSFVSGIILARLLMPEDYGCIGMLSIFMMIATSIVDGGFAAALIQKKRPTQEDYSTVFIFNLCMSFFMYIVLFLAAPIIARFYKIPILTSVLRVQGLVLIINACSIIQFSQLKKQFCFKKITIVSLMASSISLAVTIFLAYKGYGVWALVVMNLLGSFIPAVVYWLTNKWHPSWAFSKKSFKELFNFGVFILLSSVIDNFCNNIQGLLIGRFYTPATMGYYSKAKSTEDLASHSVSNVLGQVTFPLYAEYQYDKKMLANVVKRITCTIAYVSFPLMLLLFLLAKPVFLLLYSDRWLASVPYFQVLCLAGIAICLQGANYQAVAALGKGRVLFRWTLIKRSVGLVLVVGGLALFEMKGLLIGMVCTSWMIYLINAFLVDSYVGYKVIDQFKDLAPILFLALVSLMVSYFTSFVLPFDNIYLIGLVEFVIFVFIYLGGSIMFKMESYHYFLENVPLFIGKIKK